MDKVISWTGCVQVNDPAPVASCAVEIPVGLGQDIDPRYTLLLPQSLASVHPPRILRHPPHPQLCPGCVFPLGGPN